ncbi:thioredoxin [Pontimicrobium aquaticum]|uniref:Thioredoxin n=1 Tax=Pontimicrobium aquaticum TaxID=2565367 RepID=A0A4U0EZU7_9FLAO|nr:thioredoxin [Pontimicrobium aquaticum]TJY35912.1 thioredoxin [Pontimicrobium aquaticum]
MSSFKEIISKDIPVLVDFYAEWCGPCKVMESKLKEVKGELKEAISIIKINVDTNSQLAAKYQVRGVPTFILFKNGKQLWRQSGIIDKNELINIIYKFS